MPSEVGALSSADVMKRVLLAAWAVWLGGVLGLSAQSPTPTPTPPPTPTPTPGLPTTIPAGVRYATENGANVNGVRVQLMPDGSVWFLEASADRVGVLRGTDITYWQLRPDDELGANPVDFKVEGTDVWILESGQSEIPAGRCSIAKLDTVTNQVTEWTLPGSIPAAFYHAPDGTWWVPITGAALLNANFETGVTTVYRSAFTTWYSDMVVDAEGTLWLSDFGNNRIVRYVPGSDKETSWTYLPHLVGPAEHDSDRLRRGREAVALPDFGRPHGPFRSRTERSRTGRYRNEQSGLVLRCQQPGPLRLFPGKGLRHVGPVGGGGQHHRSCPGRAAAAVADSRGARRPLDPEPGPGPDADVRRPPDHVRRPKPPSSSRPTSGSRATRPTPGRSSTRFPSRRPTGSTSRAATCGSGPAATSSASRCRRSAA